jgi:hypothetical protein
MTPKAERIMTQVKIIIRPTFSPPCRTISVSSFHRKVDFYAWKERRKFDTINHQHIGGRK